MTIQHRRTKATLDVTLDEWNKMQANGLAQPYRVVAGIELKKTPAPMEVIDFLDGKKAARPVRVKPKQKTDE